MVCSAREYHSSMRTSRHALRALTWPRVSVVAVTIRPRSSAYASIRVKARQNVVALVCCTPVARHDAQRFQVDTRFISRSVIQWGRTCRQHVGGFDGTVAALLPIRAIKAYRLVAQSAGVLLDFKGRIHCSKACNEACQLRAATMC